jgi:hypothetical protein
MYLFQRLTTILFPQKFGVYYLHKLQSGYHSHNRRLYNYIYLPYTNEKQVSPGHIHIYPRHRQVHFSNSRLFFYHRRTIQVT